MKTPLFMEKEIYSRTVWRIKRHDDVILLVASAYKISQHYYLPPAAEGRGRSIIKRRPSVRSSRFCINCHISFIYEDIFTKFTENVYGYENLSLKNCSLILKNKMAAIAYCLKIIRVL